MKDEGRRMKDESDLSDSSFILHPSSFSLRSVRRVQSADLAAPSPLLPIVAAGRFSTEFPGISLV
jgi:hypothetical protein